MVASYSELLGQTLGGNYELESFCVSDALVTGGNSVLKSICAKEAIDYKPDVVVIDIGFNDALPENWRSVKQFYKSYAKIVNKFRSKNSDVRIILCKPIPIFNKELANQGRNIKEKVIPVIWTIAKVENREVVDLYSAMLWNPQAYSDKTELNEKGYAIISRAVSRLIRSNEDRSTKRYQTAFKF